MEQKEAKLSFVQFLGVLRWLIAYNVRLAPVAAILDFLSAIFSALQPLVNAYIFARLLDKIIDIVATGADPKDIIPMLGILLAYNLLTSAVSHGNSYLSNVMNNATWFKSPQVLYRHIHSLGIQTLENPEVVNKVQRSREVLGMLYGDFDRVTTFFARVITLIVTTVVVVKIMPIVAVVIFVSMIPGLASNRYYMRQSWKLYRDETERKRKAGTVFNSLIETSNLQEIVITSAYDYLNTIYSKFANRYSKADLAIMRGWRLFGFLFGSITVTASIFGYFTILKNLFKGLISVGDVTFQMRSLDIFVSNLGMVAGTYVSLYERCMRIKEVKEVFDMKPVVSDGDVILEVSEQAPVIALKKVSFKYPSSDRHVINGLDLEIKPGERIAIVGENGAGKTTLVKLLSRFYKVNKGGIYLDGKNINDVKIDSWYKNLGVLFQDYNTYSSLTLKENIWLGNSQTELDETKMELAANKANVNSFLSGYKKGYEQVLSEKFKGGTRPSTGQWQKIAIARFFYRNSPVVIFDEPTASIDAVSEAEIFGQIYEFFKNKTVIIISHRFSTVRNADKIYVLADGAIAESGNHKELMKLKGKYHKAFTIQAEGYK